MISEVLYCSNKLVFMILRFIILEPILKKMIQILEEIPKKELQNVLSNRGHIEVIVRLFGYSLLTKCVKC